MNIEEKKQIIEKVNKIEKCLISIAEWIDHNQKELLKDDNTSSWIYWKNFMKDILDADSKLIQSGINGYKALISEKLEES